MTARRLREPKPASAPSARRDLQSLRRTTSELVPTVRDGGDRDPAIEAWPRLVEVSPELIA
jgi:hypothetical protein